MTDEESSALPRKPDALDRLLAAWGQLDPGWQAGEYPIDAPESAGGPYAGPWALEARVVWHD